MQAPETIQINLGERSYPIQLGSGLLNDKNCLNQQLTGRQVLIISDSNVAPLYLGRLKSQLDQFVVETYTIAAGEPSKNVRHWLAALDKLIEMNASRDCCVIGLGGGVVGDLAGFVAASYMRGVNLIQIPTSLLAQVDSSVGGKTAINHSRGKNLIGAFHQPRHVIIDIDSLSSLPEREYRAGLAEVVKYGMIRDPDFFAWLESHTELLLNRDPNCLTQAIRLSCQHKAAVVAEDERESGIRALLNLGHTFAHAIETATGYTQFLHGEAVAIGLWAATELSAKAGICPSQDPQRVASLLDKLGLPYTTAGQCDVGQLRQLMNLDKKNLSGKLRLILLSGIGKAYIEENTEALPVAETLESLIGTPSVNKS